VGRKQPQIVDLGSVRTARDSNPNRQIRRLVLYVHPVRLSAVCAAQVRGRIQPDRQSAVWLWPVDCHADCHVLAAGIR
jgi:hypothetical protein